jgi:hypothetical protein
MTCNKYRWKAANQLKRFKKKKKKKKKKKGRGSAITVHTTKAQKWGREITPLIFNLGTRRGGFPTSCPFRLSPRARNLISIEEEKPGEYIWKA